MNNGFVSFIVAALAMVACANAHEPREQEPPATTQQRMPTIEHVSPVRDAVGAAPTRFEWTAAKDAHEYAIGIWDDVDRLMWSDFHVRGTSTTLPDDVRLEFGTYYWSVTALREGRPIAESGRSAFVVTGQFGR